MARGLALGGLKLPDVNIVELPFPDMLPAFANGNIDAAHTSEPFSTLASDRGVAAKWKATVDYAPGLTPAVLTYGPSLLHNPTDVGQRFMVAYLRGARDYTAAFKQGIDRDAIVQMLIKHTSVKDPAIYDRMGALVHRPGWHAERRQPDRPADLLHRLRRHPEPDRREHDRG